MTALRPARPSPAAPPGWRRSALLITILLTAASAAIALLCLSATQLTERRTAQHLLSRAATSLLEIDHFVTNAWPALELAAAENRPIPLDGFPIALQLDPHALADGPAAVADAIAAATASLIYDNGLDALSQSPRAFRILSQGAAFDGTIGRLTAGGHIVATAALIVSAILTLLLALALAAQTHGPARLGAPALALALGAATLWIAALIARSLCAGQADATLDPFTTDLWRIAADVVSTLVRNAAIVALSAAICAALALLGATLLQRLEPPARQFNTSYRR